MYMWHEGQASGGYKVIASYLSKLIQSNAFAVKHVFAFSDNYWGQNNSNLIVKFWMYIIRNTQIETVDHRFLVPGHFYNECIKTLVY